MPKVIQNICQVDRKAYFCRMQMASSTLFYHSEGFAAKAEGPLRLFIDATVGDQPLLAIFDSEDVLQLLGTWDRCQEILPKARWKELPWEMVRAVVPEIDLHFLPEAWYDSSCLEVYASYLKDDGVSPALDLVCESLGAVAIYREDRSGLAGMVGAFPDMQLIPLSCLLAEKWASKLAPAVGPGKDDTQVQDVLFFHVRGEQVLAFGLNQGKLTFHQQFPAFTPEEFNYHLLRVLQPYASDFGRVKALVSGQIDAASPLFARLTQYLPQVEVVGVTDLVPNMLSTFSQVEHAHAILPIALLLKP